MRILVITDLYPIEEKEIHTPRTIEAFVKNWEKMGHEIRIIKPNFLLNSYLRQKPYYKDGVLNAELSSIIKKEYRRMGFADKLLLHMLEYSKSKLDIKKVTVNILKTNELYILNG